MHKSSLFSTSSSTLVICCLFDDSHSYRCDHIVVLICISLMIRVCWPTVCCLWENVYSNHLPIFHLRLFVCWWWVVWVLCIFWIITSYQTYRLQIISQLVGCLFVLLIVSFTVQKAFKFDVVSFVYFCFCFPWEQIQKNIAMTYVRVFSLCFLLEILWFQVLHLSL